MCRKDITTLQVVLIRDLSRRMRGLQPCMTGKDTVYLDLAVGTRLGRYMSIETRVVQIAMQATTDDGFGELVDASDPADFADLQAILTATTGWRRYKALERGGHFGSATDVAAWLPDTALGRWYAVRDNGLASQIDSDLLVTLPSFALKKLVDDGFDMSPHVSAFDAICRKLNCVDYVGGLMKEFPHAVVSYDTLHFLVSRGGYCCDALEELLEIQRGHGHAPPSLEWLSSSMLDPVGLWDALAEYGYQGDVDVAWLHEHFFQLRPDDTLENVWSRAVWIFVRFDEDATVRAMTTACMGCAGSLIAAMTVGQRGPRSPAEVQLLIENLPAEHAVDAILESGMIDDAPFEWLARNIPNAQRRVLVTHRFWKDIESDWVFRNMDLRNAAFVFAAKKWFDRYNVQDLASMFEGYAYNVLRCSKWGKWAKGAHLSMLSKLFSERDLVEAMVARREVAPEAIDAHINDDQLVYDALNRAHMLDQVTPEWLRARIRGPKLLTALVHGGHIDDLGAGELIAAYKKFWNPTTTQEARVVERVHSLSVAQLYEQLGGRRDAHHFGRALYHGGHIGHCDPELVYRHGDHLPVNTFATETFSPQVLARCGVAV